jgi:subtilisin-like proprotein convertase family protein
LNEYYPILRLFIIRERQNLNLYMKFKMKTLFSIVFVVIFALTGARQLNAQITPSVFTNSAPITINDANAATPYPSNITVSGLSGTVSDINVRLNGLSHSYLSDVALLLVAPDTNKRFVLMSDCGDNINVSNVTVTFDDQASSLVFCDGGTVPTGSYQPTSRLYDNVTTFNPVDQFPAPAPQPADGYSQPTPTGTATLNGTFGGTNPNGVWSLYVMDKFTNDAGEIAGGYSLVITPSPPPTAAVVSVGGRVTDTKRRGVSNVRVVMTDSKGATRTALSDSLGNYSFDGAQAGETYVFTASRKGYTFDQSTQVHTIIEETNNVNFVVLAIKLRSKFNG